MFALGAMNSDDRASRTRYTEAGAGVAKICNEMYNVEYTHLHGENVRVEGDTVTRSNTQYLMRPGKLLLN